MLVFPLPLAVWAMLRRLADELEARRLVTILVVLLVVQFLMSPEILPRGAPWHDRHSPRFRMAPAEEQRALLSLGVWIILAYAISAVLLLPYLYYMFAFGMPHGVFFSPWRSSIDLAQSLCPDPCQSVRQFAGFRRDHVPVPQLAPRVWRLHRPAADRYHRAVRARALA